MTNRSSFMMYLYWANTLHVQIGHEYICIYIYVYIYMHMHMGGKSPLLYCHSTLLIFNTAVRLITLRFHTQMSSLWLYYRHSSHCQQSSQADYFTVSHANVVTVTVSSPPITLSTKQSGWLLYGFTRKCRHCDCIIAIHHIVNKAVRLVTLRFNTQMSSLWLYYGHSSHCPQCSQADDLSVSHANVVAVTVSSPLIILSRM